MAETIRLAILEDHRVVGESLARSLAATDGLEVTAVVTSLAELRAVIGTARPAIVVADVALDDGVSLDLPRELGPGGPAVLFLTGHLRPDYVRAALDAGAAGYLAKSEPLEEVLRAIHTIAAGGTAFSRKLLAAARNTDPPTARERAVLALVVVGLSNKEIGARLGIEERTVESHLRRMFDRYAARSRVDLAVRALREGWASLEGNGSGE